MYVVLGVLGSFRTPSAFKSLHTEFIHACLGLQEVRCCQDDYHGQDTLEV